VIIQRLLAKSLSVAVAAGFGHGPLPGILTKV